MILRLMLYLFSEKDMTKKNRLILLIPAILFFTLLISGCTQQEYINNKETGEIDHGQPSELRDGSYTMIAASYDHLGYRQQIDFSVYSGLITKVDLTEKTPTGIQKTDTPEWPKKQTGLTVSKLYHQVASQIIQKQSGKIDTITGATKTVSDFSLMTEQFLNEAKKGQTGTHNVILPDTWQAELAINADNISSMIISFDEKNHMTKIDFSEIINGKPRNTNLEYKKLYDRMCGQTLSTDSLAPLTPEPAFIEEYDRYNSLLNMIDNQRKGLF